MRDLALVGVILLMFIAGLETDVEETIAGPPEETERRRHTHVP